MGKLVIDLGHGGHDPGAIGSNKTHEADVVLAIGKELNELLKDYLKHMEILSVELKIFLLQKILEKLYGLVCLNILSTLTNPNPIIKLYMF